MIPFDECSRLPADGDNVAIATRRLERGTRIALGDGQFEIAHTILEGHRFVFEPIANGAPLLSWGLAFGDATRDLVPGEYVCNARILKSLGERDIDFELPEAPNFLDRFEPYELDPATIRPAEQVAPVELPGTFQGYLRAGGRGIGTRNNLIVIGLTSGDAALAAAIAERADVVAVTHTEGGGANKPHNLDFVMRALAGFVVHANTGAAVVVDRGVGAYSNDELRTFIKEHGYALEHVPHEFFDASGSFDRAVDDAIAVIERLRPAVDACQRSEQPLSGLKIALQCGGSDAFSGVSGNSLAGWVAKELIRHGGAANLAETDELIGAESYVLDKVRNEEVARRFLGKIATFKQRAERHGASAEGNPSGGNNYRGLYNIALKSLGAARKKDPDVRLDEVLDYGQPMAGGGYYFMDSPGNDLESIAGQVASGCNLILFITGNGSITNFPFVPTLKFVTTTGRFELLSNEMDVNAGRYNDGMPMDELGAETFELARRVASGERSKGERAGHSQVSLWRAWPQAEAVDLDAMRAQPQPSGKPLATVAADVPAVAFEAFAAAAGPTTDLVGLIMPTSLCSGQVAQLIADGLNQREQLPGGLSRFVALVHTEGCGSANAEDLYLQTLRGHIRHPFTQRALLLEHGCEKTHNDAIRHWLHERGEGTERYGFASVQLDGGIDRVRGCVEKWFDDSLANVAEPERVTVGVESIRLGLVTTVDLDEGTATTLAALCAGIANAGGLVVVPDNDRLLQNDTFLAGLLVAPDNRGATLGYGERAEVPGLHVMRAPAADPGETVTGLGGTGVELMLACIGERTLQAHPMIPMLLAGRSGDDVDVPNDADVTGLLARIAATLSGNYVPKLHGAGNVHFQLTRGELGVSL